MSSRVRLWVFLVGAAGFAALFAAACFDLPAFGTVPHPYGARAVLDGHATAAPAHLPPHWQLTGVLLGLLSAALAITLATLAVRRPVHTGTVALLAPVRRL